MKKIFKFFLFLSLAPLTIMLELLALDQLIQPRKFPEINSHVNPGENRFISPLVYSSRVYASLPEAPVTSSEFITTSDSRSIIIQRYLENHNSEMKPYDEVASMIVEISDRYGLDWRLLVAIAQQESSLGKNMPENCFNAWGYGIHSRGTLCFENWYAAIETVAKGLKLRYIDIGLTTPEQIMSKYTPSSSGSWAESVTKFLDHLSSS